MAFGCLTLALLMAGGLVWRSAQSIVTPYVVEVDNTGQVRAVGEAATPYRPADAQIAYHLAHFITLVGDADRRHLACGHAGIGERLASAVELGTQDVLGIVLDPVGRREVLRECLLGEAAHAAIGVEHDRARAGGALVEGEQVGHGDSARGLTAIPRA